MNFKKVNILLSLFPGISMFAMESDNIAINDSINFSEIVVTGTRNETDIRHLPMTVTTINNEQITDRHEQSLLPIITELVPSLFTTSRGIMGYSVSTGAAGGMSMRGIGGTPTTGMLMLIDGHPQYMGLMGHPIADAYQSMMAEKVEVVRGPASMIYGSNAMGGVINIITKKQKENSLNNHINLSYGSYNTMIAEVGSSLRRNKFYYYINGAYNRTDGHRDNMEFEQYGGYGKIGYDISDNWNIFADINLTHFNASNSGTETRPIYDNDSQVTRGMTSLSLENKFTRSSGAIKLFYNWGEHKINDGYYLGDSPREYLFNSNDNMFGANIFQNFNLFKGNRITLGIDYQRFGGKAVNLNNDGTETSLVDKTEDNIAGYAEMSQSIGSFMTLSAGTRYDYHSVSKGEWVPQFGISIYPINTGEIKLIASKGYRVPTIRELYMFNPRNPELKPERLWNYEISWNQRVLDGKFSYGVNIYYIKGDNIIRTETIEGRPLNVNTGEIENKGFEISASYRIIRPLTFMANYSYLDMKNPVVAAPENKFYAGLNYKKGIISVATGIQYIKGLYTSASATDPIKENYTLWNVRAGVQLLKNLEIYAKGENLLNNKYEINSGFPMPGATVMGGINFKF